MKNGIENLRILAETTVADFPEASLEVFIKDAVAEYNALEKERDDLQELIKAMQKTT